MSSLLYYVFITSLLGSIHCAGMCGPFVALLSSSHCSDSCAPKTQNSLILQLIYNMGRLCSYLLLGFIAGSMGALFDLGTAFAGMGRLTALLAGGTLILVALGSLFSLFGFPVPKYMKNHRLYQGLNQIIVKVQKRALSMAPVKRSIGLGLASGFLPCGWLYAFVLAAAGTGSALTGALLMSAFWLGTVPILLGLGAGARELLFRSKRPLQMAVAFLIAIVGLYTLNGRWEVGLDEVIASQQRHGVSSSL
ncbi:MAG: sulfite exporter TauE/SafE family protein, partial [Planctomycetes bacterium]|nr:sulfite exporter TauE/SafE family protein [Planctomycetota bacterium]